MTKGMTMMIAMMWIGTTTFSQGVSTEWAYALLKTLDEGTADPDRMHIYLMAAQAQISKFGEYDYDLDSARSYMRKAAVLNEKVKSKDADAFQVLLESLLMREKKEEKKGKALAEKAVHLLQNANNPYYAGVAYLSLYEY
jgi:hypothetical protein